MKSKNNKIKARFSITDILDDPSSYGHFFKLIFNLFALLNVAVFFYFLYCSIKNNIMDYPEKYVASYLITLLFVGITSLIGFKIWKRRIHFLVSLEKKSDFPVIDSFSLFMKIIGENIGISLGTIGFIHSLLCTFVLKNNNYYYQRELGIEWMALNETGIIIYPIIGGIIILTFKYFS